MSFDILFTLVLFILGMILWLVFGLWPQRTAMGPLFWGSLILSVLLLLLGWKTFGPLVHP